MWKTTLDPRFVVNDSDPENDVLSVVEATSNNAQVTINSDYSLQYIANAGLEGVASFTYRVRDNLGAQAIGELKVTVTATSPQPAADSDNPETGAQGGSMAWLLLLLFGQVASKKRILGAFFTHLVEAGTADRTPSAGIAFTLYT